MSPETCLLCRSFVTHSRFRPENLPKRASIYFPRANLAPPEVPCAQGACRADVPTDADQQQRRTAGMHTCIGGSATTRITAAVCGLTTGDQRAHSVPLRVDYEDVEDKAGVARLQPRPVAGPARSTPGTPGHHSRVRGRSSWMGGRDGLAGKPEEWLGGENTDSHAHRQATSRWCS